MENAITALIVIGLLVMATVGLTERSLASQAIISESSRVLQERQDERSRTELTSVGASSTGNLVQVMLKNSGNFKLMDWLHWDVILQYSNAQGNQLKWYPYGAGADTWSMQTLMSLAPLTPELIEPGILNPGEYLVIQVDVSTNPVGVGTTNQATVVTPNGIVTTASFSR